MAGIVNDSIGGMGGMGLFGGGYGAGGVIEGLLLGTLLGRRGLGGEGECGDRCCEKMVDMHDHHNDHDHTVEEIHDVQMEVCAAERQMADIAMELQECCGETKEKILETKYDLGVQILESKYANALQGKDIIHDIDIQSCGISRNIDSVKFNQEIIAKDAAMQLADCCCKLENKIRDSIDATNKAACDTQKLMIEIDAKNDRAAAEKERRELQREIDELKCDKRQRDGNDTQNILNNFGTITNSLNKVLTALGNTAA